MHMAAAGKSTTLVYYSPSGVFYALCASAGLLADSPQSHSSPPSTSLFRAFESSSWSRGCCFSSHSVSINRSCRFIKTPVATVLYSVVLPLNNLLSMHLIRVQCNKSSHYRSCASAVIAPPIYWIPSEEYNNYNYSKA